MKTNIFAIALLCLLGPVMGFIITKNTHSRGAIHSKKQETSINSGVYYSVLGNSVSSFWGFKNHGRFYLTAIAGSPSSLETDGESFLNYGVTSCDSSRSKGSHFYIKPKHIFKNAGKMFLGLGEVANSAVGFTITAAATWHNSGMIVLKSWSTSSSANIGGTTLANEGSICLYRTAWSPLNSIQGSGCIAVHAGSGFTTTASSSVITSTQIIHLGHRSSHLTIGGFVSLAGSLLRGLNPVYTVTGFGGGNNIVVDFTFRSHNYHPHSGILTLIGHLHKVSFFIGKGYKSRYFKAEGAILGLVSRSISYTEECPNSPPPICVCDPEFPVAPPPSTGTVPDTAAPPAANTQPPAANTQPPATATTLTTATPVTSTISSTSTSTSISSTSTVVPISTSISSTNIVPVNTAVSSSTSSTSTAEEAKPTTGSGDDDNWT